MVETYWNVGRMIIEQEQQGKERAEYGAFIIRNLSLRLTNEFDKGFDERELRRMRQFFLTYPLEDKAEIRGTSCPESPKEYTTKYSGNSGLTAPRIELVPLPTPDPRGKTGSQNLVHA